MKTSLLLFAPAALLLGCASLPHPSPDDVRRAQATWPEANLDSLEQGRTDFANDCSGCHALPAVDAKGPGQWPKVVSVMADRGDLDPQETRLIEQFLVTFSQRPPRKE